MFTTNKSAVVTMLAALGCLSTSAEASTDISAMIFNGTDTSAEEWPSIASIYYDASDYGGDQESYCTGTILDEQHVLTAAHCLYDGDEVFEPYLIYTSVVPQMNDESDAVNGLVTPIRASEFYAHPDFVDSAISEAVPWPNDIAIIKLETPMNVDSNAYTVQGLSSQASSYRQTDEEFVAVGYGITETGSYGELLQTTLNYQTQANCSLGAGDSQICTTGDYNFSTDVRNSTCNGDSGGPLFWYDGSQYVQIGVTSYGWTGCSNEFNTDTAVFTEVADYSAWVSSVLSGNETPVYTVTDQERYDYVYGSDSTSSTSSSDSGGTVSLNWLLLMALVAASVRFRRRSIV
ncbi:S1 family peptidase [Vibrio hippocampi]|uniref:Peptidase S1 domain-containing protein n=1 Tax=Vibrio hippocampi TaxID=654686 RepID=A0ABM8ZH98_9VIBR|nr:serine protease [Vibrio hippocampi]CAH0525744.1 hypothetical protein VHP8226_01274 [Vibrio hippocampi]